MNTHSVSSEQLKALKQKLDASIKSRAALEEDFKSQSTLLIKFISRLSQVCKGLDLKLDNKLANFRTLVTKSTPFDEIELEVTVISDLLKKFAAINEQSIRDLNNQFLDAGKSLQKATGLPNQLRRDLRGLLRQVEEGKDTLIQYMPLLRELLALFNQALLHKNQELATNALPNTAANFANSPTITNYTVESDIIDKFVIVLNQLMLSDTHQKQLVKIKSKLNNTIDCPTLIDCFLETFSLLCENLQLERDTAETFLSSLNNTLSVVQTAVNNTLFDNKATQKQYGKLNQQLTQQLQSMSGSVEHLQSIPDLKDEISDKIQFITETLNTKRLLEQQCQQRLTQQLQAMQQEIKALERQSKQFETRLHEQHLKSMQDALTKLGNRGAFDEHFAQQIVRFQKKPFELAIVVLDLDNFKAINDTYGHSAGDKTLQVIAKTMQQSISKDVFIARYGGEEFVLIFNNLNKKSIIQQLENLRKKIAALPFKFKSNNVNITVSIGVTHVTQADNVHIAFERADSGLYQAKARGKNLVVYVE